MLYPELRKFAADDRANALRVAAETRFDAIELIGVIIALAATVLVTRYSGTGMGLADRFGAAVANFVIAIPLLLLLAGPFYLRRTRRGLQKQIKWNSLRLDKHLRKGTLRKVAQAKQLRLGARQQFI